MVAFELRGVTGGWDTAALGTSDHVEFAVYDAPAPAGAATDADSTDADATDADATDADATDASLDPDPNPVTHRYGSVHQLLRLYDCARRERPTHPQFLGYDLSERGNAVVLDLRTGTIETTYDALKVALEAFLGDVFDALDAHPTHGSRADHLETMHAHDVALVDVAELYEDLSTRDDRE